MRRSPVSRFLGVLLTAVIAVQFPLTAIRPSCIMASAEMAGAPMGADVMGTAVRTATEPADGATMPKGTPCNQQMRWPVCQAMGPCITALAPADVCARTMPQRPATHPTPLVVIAPPARTYPPDLPPPRA